MNINILRTFIEIVEKGSLTKAAHHLHLTQPAVTKHLQNLEELCGARLIERGFEATLTTEGTILYKHGKSILESLEIALLEVSLVKDVVQGDLYIGASTIPGQYLMPKALALFKSFYPEAQTLLNISDTRNVISNILDEKILIGAVGSKPENPKLYAQEFYYDELVMIAASNSIWVKKPQINLREIIKYPFIWRENGSATRKTIENIFNKYEFKKDQLNIVMELNSTEAIITAVEADLGISLISKCAAKRALDNGTIVTLDTGLTLERSLYLVALCSNMKRKIVSEFFRIASDAV